MILLANSAAMNCHELQLVEKNILQIFSGFSPNGTDFS